MKKDFILLIFLLIITTIGYAAVSASNAPTATNDVTTTPSDATTATSSNDVTSETSSKKEVSKNATVEKTPASSTTASTKTDTSATAAPSNKPVSLDVTNTSTEETNNKSDTVEETPAASTEEEEKAKPFSLLDGLSGNFDITSNYISYGVSNSNNTPAIQGGLDYKLPIAGIYTSVWGSNVNFDDINGRTATIELDTAVGVANDLSDNWSYDLSWLRYNYPETQGLEYADWVSVLTYKAISGQIGYSDNVFATSHSGAYYEADLDWEIPAKRIHNIEGFSLLANIGYYELPASAGPSYSYYMLGASKQFKEHYTAILQWFTTDGNQHLGNLDDARVVFTLAADF